MTEQALLALISGSVGLLGALLGFAGSLLASRRMADAARVQRRYERVHEMRAEVLPLYYGDLLEWFDRLRSVYARTFEVTYQGGKVDWARLTEASKEMERSVTQAREQAEQMKTRFRRIVLWFPEVAQRPTWHLLNGLTAELNKWRDEFTVSLGVILDVEDQSTMDRLITSYTERLNALNSEFVSWLNGEGRRRLQRVEEAYRMVLGTDYDSL
jgi:hypothetical protein